MQESPARAEEGSIIRARGGWISLWHTHEPLVCRGRYDISSVTSMAAAGCQVIIFTTGRGTPTGNAIVPVLKVTANEHTYSWMEDNMDVDLSGIIRGEQTIEESGGMLLEKLHEIANGKLTKAEAYGFSDIAVDHVCRFV